MLSKAVIVDGVLETRAHCVPQGTILSPRIFYVFFFCVHLLLLDHNHFPSILKRKNHFDNTPHHGIITRDDLFRAIQQSNLVDFKRKWDNMRPNYPYVCSFETSDNRTCADFDQKGVNDDICLCFPRF